MCIHECAFLISAPLSFFSGDRPLTDFINGDAKTVREKPFSCQLCHKRYSHETGEMNNFSKHHATSSSAAYFKKLKGIYNIKCIKFIRFSIDSFFWAFSLFIDTVRSKYGGSFRWSEIPYLSVSSPIVPYVLCPRSILFKSN